VGEHLPALTGARPRAKPRRRLDPRNSPRKANCFSTGVYKLLVRQ
jgi:hypothetical protein